ncbi:hypothetical protein BC833DRAFT_593880 [Globomyces pollinis-pini]|nr:hypothetical protein BC833DRAFT_593880 [Globomyces pollinis-pini]
MIQIVLSLMMISMVYSIPEAIGKLTHNCIPAPGQVFCRSFDYNWNNPYDYCLGECGQSYVCWKSCNDAGCRNPSNGPDTLQFYQHTNVLLCAGSTVEHSL